MADQSLRAIELVSFINLESLEEKRVQFNPVELSHGVAAEYTEFPVVGLSYKPQQYAGTTNREFSLTLQFKVESPAERDAVDDTLRFLQSLMYAEEPGGSPPDVLFVWPSLTSSIVKLLGASTKHVQFNAVGAPTRTDLDITMRRQHDRPMLQSEVRERGIRG